ncbi:hypothetical protein [Brevibacillus daliensis]|uniref:hypothetical protein n=1 Tax=Brevibacillus daliensis TaxID=2892995 RepID=UPI001E398A21|nr:hypothetical protein [Brevibacillus daliensis]
MRKKGVWFRILLEERGTILPLSLFFLIILSLLLSMVLLVEQADLVQMKTQQTADLIVKGARTAGQWIEYDKGSGRTKTYLFATTEEALRHKAKIIRGAREEAEILYKLNAPELQAKSKEVSIIHQKGEQKSLYTQGIYHVAIHVEKKLYMLFDDFDFTFFRTAQAEIKKVKN